MSHELLYEINFDYFLLYFFSIVKERFTTIFAFALKEQISIALALLTFVISNPPLSTYLHLVGLVGLEPTTPALSTRCSNQLSYSPTYLLLLCKWWRLPGSNRSPPACKAGALPDELNPHLFGSLLHSASQHCLRSSSLTVNKCGHLTFKRTLERR